MKVLVTGGTGFVGGEIARALGARGNQISLLVRSEHSHSAQELSRLHNARLVPGNILDAPSLENAATGMDAVIHLVGIISESGSQTFENVHTRGAGNVVSAAKRSGVRRFVLMSALGTRPDARARYHKSKWAAEELVRASGMEWTIFRPSIIYGPGDAFVNLFARISRWSPIVPMIGNGETRFAPIAVESVADAFAKSLCEPRSIGKTFDLCGPEVLTLREIIDSILEITRRRRLKVSVPFPLARFQATMLEFLFGRLLRKPPPLNRDQLLMLQEDNTGDCGPAVEIFDLPARPFRDGIARYL